MVEKFAVSAQNIQFIVLFTCIVDLNQSAVCRDAFRFQNERCPAKIRA